MNIVSGNTSAALVIRRFRTAMVVDLLGTLSPGSTTIMFDPLATNDHFIVEYILP
jgi:hypothetical protein